MNPIYELRTQRGWSQETLAAKVNVSRQAVSRWETGETLPSIDTLMNLSKVFNVTINEILGLQLCQCCGMPLNDSSLLAKTKEGEVDEKYCKWCEHNGSFLYSDIDELIENSIPHMVNESVNEESARAYLRELLPQLEYWKSCDNEETKDEIRKIKKALIDDINSLKLQGLGEIDTLHPLLGSYINIEYTLPNGEKIKYLKDDEIYFGNQYEVDENHCYGVAANKEFILISKYEKDGLNPEVVIYKKR